MSSPLKQNTATIQELLNTINSLPDAGGVELPELTNEGTAADLLVGKELVDGDGNKVTGTFTIDSELTTQDNLISQIQTALQNKSAATGEDVTSETNAYTTKLATLETAITALETELQGKASGGSSNGVEVEVITITATDTSQIPFTLKRVTKTIGSYNGDSATGIPSVGSAIISSHINTYRFAYSNSPVGTYVNKSEALTLNSGELVASQYTFAVPYVAVFINDPTQPAIYEE